MAPHGIYKELELEIEKPDDDVKVDDRDFRDETGSYSIVVKGLFNGDEFTFRSREDFEIDVDLDPPLEISDGSKLKCVHTHSYTFLLPLHASGSGKKFPGLVCYL